jgi:hypothetical protein
MVSAPLRNPLGIGRRLSTRPAPIASNDATEKLARGGGTVFRPTTASANSARLWKGNEEPIAQVTCSTAKAPNVVPVVKDAFDMKVRVANRNGTPLNTVLPNDLLGEFVEANQVANSPGREVSYPTDTLDNKCSRG